MPAWLPIVPSRPATAAPVFVLTAAPRAPSRSCRSTRCRRRRAGPPPRRRCASCRRGQPAWPIGSRSTRCSHRLCRVTAVVEPHRLYMLPVGAGPVAGSPRRVPAARSPDRAVARAGTPRGNSPPAVAAPPRIGPPAPADRDRGDAPAPPEPEADVPASPRRVRDAAPEAVGVRRPVPVGCQSRVVVVAGAVDDAPAAHAYAPVYPGV